jgi:8-oxo-dGTP pyrophosphatase MutT (NUDIX family)
MVPFMFVSMKATPNRWKTTGTKKIYDNPWIEVTEDQIINPSGKPGIYGKVSFKNLAVAIIPLDQHQNTWIVGQHRYTLNEYSWELPMGGVPFSEDPLVGAQRELREETGITAKEWSLLLKMHTSNSVTNELAYTYIAKDLSIGTPEFDETEDIQIKKIALTELLELVMAGEITDGLSVGSILKIARILGL